VVITKTIRAKKAANLAKKAAKLAKKVVNQAKKAAKVALPVSRKAVASPPVKPRNKVKKQHF